MRHVRAEQRQPAARRARSRPAAAGGARASRHAALQLVRHATGRAADDPAAGVRARHRFLRDLAAFIER
ncbi:MAG: hypothetical protein R2749_04005 [Acidimicrobiales bacterium]